MNKPKYLDIQSFWESLFEPSQIFVFEVLVG